MRLGIDIDGTIMDTQLIVLEIYNREFNKDVQLEDLVVSDDITLGLPKEEEIMLWKKWEEEICHRGLPFCEAATMLQQRVNAGDEIYFITARDDLKPLKHLTAEWLSKNGFPYNGANLYIGVYDKGRLAKELAIDLFFEDAPYHLDDLIKHNIDLVIFDAPYNRQYPSCYKRIKNWSEFT